MNQGAASKPAPDFISDLENSTIQAVTLFVSLLLPRTIFHFFTQNDRFRNLFHGLTLLSALALNTEICLLFGQAKFTLQNSFRALDQLTRYEPLRQI
jgi:hypothetical protein